MLAGKQHKSHFKQLISEAKKRFKTSKSTASTSTLPDDVTATTDTNGVTNECEQSPVFDRSASTGGARFDCTHSDSSRDLFNDDESTAVEVEVSATPLYTQDSDTAWLSQRAPPSAENTQLPGKPATAAMNNHDQANPTFSSSAQLALATDHR